MKYHSRIVGILIVVCVTVVSRGPVFAGALVNNIVAKGIANEMMSVSQENLGPPCGFGEEGDQWSELAAYAEISIGLQPASSSSWLELARTRWALGQCDQALAALAKSSDLYGGDSNPAQLQLARSLYTLGERELSKTIFRNIGGSQYVTGLANHAQQNGDFRSAIFLFALANEIDPLLPIGDGFGVVAEQISNLPESAAESIWLELSSETPSNQPVHWIAASELALLTDDPTASKDALMRGLELTNDPHFIYLSMARTLVKLQDWDEAIINYKLAVNVKPTASVIPYMKIAEIETTMGNYGEVVVWSNKARTLFPDSHWPDFVQGYAALQLGRLDEAETLFESAYNIQPSDGYSLYYIGVINEAQGKVLESARYFEQAASVNRVPSETCAWLLLAGDLYQRAGNNSKADQMYEDGLIICPGDSALSDRLTVTRKLQDR